jgi:WS/DGAT/MGAT family acyltransferase
VKRLSAVDVDVLQAGAGASHGHVAQLLVLEPGDPTLGLAELRSWYAGRLHRASAFRRRLVQVPLQVHRPLWADDEAFDLDHHVRALRVEPGDRAGLEAAVGRLLGLPLDLRHPPWEAWLLEGLDGGRVAVLTKQHLAAVDDRTGDEIAVAALDVEPYAPTGDVPPWAPEPLPTDLERMAGALVSRVRRPTALVEAAQRLARARRQVAPRRVPSVFDQPLTTRRQVASTTFALGPVKAVKDHHDVTVNDVVLAACAGGLRRWLDERDALPADPLLALVPVSVAGDRVDPDSGNHVSSVVSSLATDTRDPALRIQVIQDATREARRRRAIGARRLRDWAQFAAPAVLGQAGRVALRTIAETHPPPCNLIVANIPGPTVPLYVAGAALTDLFFFGPLHEGVPLDITVVSYGDRMDVSLVGCPDTDPDVGELVVHLDAALEELVDSVPMADRSLDPAIAPSALSTGDDPGGARG